MPGDRPGKGWTRITSWLWHHEDGRRLMKGREQGWALWGPETPKSRPVFLAGSWPTLEKATAALRELAREKGRGGEDAEH